MRIPVNTLDCRDHGGCLLHETLGQPEKQSILAENSLDEMKTNGSAMQPSCINIKYWNSPTKGKLHVIETLSALRPRKDLRFGRRALGRHLFQVTWTPAASLLPPPCFSVNCFFWEEFVPKVFGFGCHIIYNPYSPTRRGAFSFSFPPFAAA